MNRKKMRKVFLVVFLSIFVSTLAVMSTCAEEKVLGYEDLREYAKRGEPYPGQPGKGKKLGFANIMAGIPFCVEVQNSIVRQAKLAGFEEKDIYIMDNQYNSTIGLQNADIMLAKHPDVFIEFQADSKVNSIVAEKFGKAGIPIIAVDVAVPGAPFMGVNNWHAAVMAGNFAADLIEKEWGGWNAVDLVILGQMPAGGEVTMLRSEGFAWALGERFGFDYQTEPKVVRGDFGMGEAEEAKAAMTNILAAHPKAKKIVITTINEETMQGALAAMEIVGRWDPGNTIVASQGCDALGRQLIHEGKIDGSIAYFPEKYGQYLVPAVCAFLLGQPVPPHLYIDNVVITRENIDQYYPE